MEDLAVLLKKNFLEQMYKKKTETFGKVEERIDKMNQQRKSSRHNAFFEKRKIPVNLTPISSPAMKSEKKLRNSEKVSKAPNKRLEMLAKWKAEKEKKKHEEKGKQKPIFKVTHVDIKMGLPNLETLNEENKKKTVKSKFAPANHKFKPPANIQPINFKHLEDKPKMTKTIQRSQIITRSQTRSVIDAEKMKPVTTPKAKTKKLSKSKSNIEPKDTKAERKTTAKYKTPSKLVKKKEMEVNTEKPEDEKKLSKEVVEIDTNNKRTPNNTEPLVYISPFVTISRGKDSARKEYEARRLTNHSFTISSTSSATSPQAGAAYFASRLDNQVSRLQELCDHWTKYKEETSLPEEAISIIDVAIGQTNLLMTKKFMQFQGLIAECQNKDSETPVTCEDLHGFWDMIYLQVVNLDKRFENLNAMKLNNWKEVLPEVKKPVMRKKGRPPKVAKASSSLLEAIRAAKKKQQEENSGAEVVKEEKTPQNKRISHLVSIRSSELSHRKSSPGLMMMKVAQYAKGIETPVKGILKSDSVKSVKSQSKCVVFQEERRDATNVENDLNVSNLQSNGTAPRRSSRLSKTKLF